MSESLKNSETCASTGWRIVKLAEIATKIQDGTHFSPHSTSGPFRYLTSKNVRLGKLDLADCGWISEVEHRGIYGRCDVQFGDLLLTKDGANTGNATLNSLKEEFSLLSSVAIIRTDDIEAHTPFVLQYLLSPQGQQRIKDLMSGNAITRLTLEKINRFTIPLPPVGHQRKIARILTTLDNLIEKTEALIAKYQAIKQGMMHDLFTRGVDAHGHLRPTQAEAPDLYKQSELEWIPKEWETPMGEGLADLITKGESPTWQGFDYQDEGVLFVTSENVRDGFIDVSKPKYVPDTFDDKLYRSRLAPGDILINLVGASIGRCCQVPDDIGRANINQAVCLFRAKSPDLANWLTYYLQLPEVMNRLTSEQVETARANVSLTDVREFLFPVPKQSEIKQTIEILRSLEQYSHAEKRNNSILQKAKSGLMQDLLTGKVRVKVDEAEEVVAP